MDRSVEKYGLDGTGLVQYNSNILFQKIAFLLYRVLSTGKTAQRIALGGEPANNWQCFLAIIQKHIRQQGIAEIGVGLIEILQYFMA